MRTGLVPLGGVETFNDEDPDVEPLELIPEILPLLLPLGVPVE